MRGFGLTIEPLAGDAVRVALRGELDLEHAYTFDEELRQVEGRRPSCLVLDLRGLSFLDSCGLARLLAARRRARREKRRLLLVRGGGSAATIRHHCRRRALRDRPRGAAGATPRDGGRHGRGVAASRTSGRHVGSKNVALRLAGVVDEHVVAHQVGWPAGRQAGCQRLQLACYVPARDPRSRPRSWRRRPPNPPSCRSSILIPSARQPRPTPRAPPFASSEPEPVPLACRAVGDAGELPERRGRGQLRAAQGVVPDVPGSVPRLAAEVGRASK